ncbi:MAG: hypothetical protein MJ003_00560 [Paludibacteraceae bacterium]|nr:hypothetical protein [Paludibacteraceae bacterium]
MKKFLLFIAALITAMCAMAQEKFYVYMNDGTTDEYTVANCDSISFTEPKAPTTGYADRIEGEGTVKVKWLQLWADGPKFAEYNVGAASVGEYGGYYCWGMSKDKDPDGEYYEGEDDIQGGDHDTALNLWGDNWQMPTKEDFDALLANCTVEWKSAKESGYGVAGRLYTGKGDYSGNSVFFPAAGWCDSGKIKLTVYFGYYWSPSPDGSSNAFSLSFGSGNQMVSKNKRSCGYPVRAVLNE